MLRTWKFGMLSAVSRNCLGCDSAVPGQHNDPQPVRVEQANGFRGRVLDPVGDADQPGEPAVERQQHHRLPFAAQLLDAGQHARDIGRVIGHQGRVAECGLTALDGSGHALTGDGLEVLRGGNGQALFFGPLDDGGRQRVFAAALQAGREPQDVVRRETWGRFDRGEAGLALGECAGLVHHERVGPV